MVCGVSNFVPLSSITSKTGYHLVLDAGHISVRSDLAPKSELNSVRSKKGQKYTDQDFDKLEALMYDKFFLKLQAAQVRLYFVKYAYVDSSATLSSCSETTSIPA